MKKSLLFFLSLLVFSPIWGQSFYETHWTSGNITYFALIIYYDDDDILVRVNYKSDDKLKVAEYMATASSYTLDNGSTRYHLDGVDAQIVYNEGETQASYSADNFTFDIADGEWDLPYVTDDSDLNANGSLAANQRVDGWEELDPTEKFTEDYVYRFFNKDEELYGTLCSYHPEYALANPSLDNEFPGEWRVIMEAETGYEEQNWLTNATWPKDDVAQLWNEGKDITDVSYGNGVWLVTMSSNTGFTDQSWNRTAAWPEEWLAENWRSGKMITEVAYGDGQWLLVTSENSKYKAQKYIVSKEWPKEKLEELWKSTDYKISSMAYGQGHWVIVISQYKSGNPAQRIRAGAEFPKEEIAESWDAGFRITSVVYGDEWVVVLTDGATPRESYNSGEEFPSVYVNEKWDEDLRITEAAYSYQEKNSSNIVTFVGTASSTGVSNNTVVLTETPVNNVNQSQNPTTFNDVPTIHLIMVANTKVPDIGVSCGVDKEIVLDEFTEISNALGVTLNKHIIDGDQLNRNNVASTLSNLSVSSNDVVVFVYTGHGFRWADQVSTYPRMALFYSRYDAASNQNTMELEEVHRILASKGARLTLAIGDCCNNNIGVTSREGGGSLASRTYSNGSAARLRKLFFESSGNIVVAAARPEETSCGSAITGGYFINAFFSALDKEVSRINEAEPTWSSIMDNSLKSAEYKTQNLQGCSPQHGVYKSTVR